MGYDGAYRRIENGNNSLYQVDAVMVNDERTLVQRAVRHDAEAFASLYDRFVDKIFKYIYYKVRTTSQAEELTGQVFLKAWESIGSYRWTERPFAAWLYRIAHNLVANWHRDRSRKQEIPLDDLPVLPTKGDHPERNLVRSQEQDALLRLIRRLPPERQNLLILKFVENMSNSEIGQIMGRSEGAVKSLYHRTLLALRDQLGDQNINLEGD